MQLPNFVVCAFCCRLADVHMCMQLLTKKLKKIMVVLKSKRPSLIEIEDASTSCKLVMEDFH